MCMDCPEQQEGATVARWQIIQWLKTDEGYAFARDYAIDGDASHIFTAIENLPELTNEDAEYYYREIND